jgi:hypothetical protein
MQFISVLWKKEEFFFKELSWVFSGAFSWRCKKQNLSQRPDPVSEKGLVPDTDAKPTIVQYSNHRTGYEHFTLERWSHCKTELELG